AGGDPRARTVERLHRDLEPLAFRADDVGARQLHVFVENVRGVGGALAELVLFLAHGDARRVARHDEAGDPLVAILRVSEAREGRVPAGVSAGRDPAPLSGEDVLVPYLADVGAHPGDVRTRVRLAAGIRGEDGRLGQHREV